MEAMLSKSNFKNWLLSRPEGYLFNPLYGLSNCPIATYLKDLDGKVHQVGYANINAFLPSSSKMATVDGTLAPEWVYDFIYPLDQRERTIDVNMDGRTRVILNPLTVEEILRYLKEDNDAEQSNDTETNPQVETRDPESERVPELVRV